MCAGFWPVVVWSVVEALTAFHAGKAGPVSEVGGDRGARVGSCECSGAAGG